MAVYLSARNDFSNRSQELCESGGGRSGLPSPNKPTVSEDVKQHSSNQLFQNKLINPAFFAKGQASFSSFFLFYNLVATD